MDVFHVIRTQPNSAAAAAAGACRYTAKERASMIEHIENRPDAMWKTSFNWSFKNESKTYGSPMCDATWEELHGQDGRLLLRHLVGDLREAAVPWNTPKPSTRRVRP